MIHLDPIRTTLDEAVRILDHLGSANDPIFFKGKETTPADLLHSCPQVYLSRIRIGYFAARLRRVERGTFMGMITDRGGVEQATENEKWPAGGVWGR
jgi:hypothetical protein